MIMLKSEFAARCGVTKSRVSQWLRAGQIGPEALVGAGRSAKLDAAVALAHLRERLASDERFGMRMVCRPISIRLDAEDDDDDDDGVLIDVELGLQQLVDCGEKTPGRGARGLRAVEGDEFRASSGSRSSLGRQKPRKAPVLLPDLHKCKPCLHFCVYPKFRTRLGEKLAFKRSSQPVQRAGPPRKDPLGLSTALFAT